MVHSADYANLIRLEGFQMAIKKSQGVTRTEELLSVLCDNTFLKLWSYPNPFKEDGKELCDLIAVFADHVFVFFDRESRKFDGAIKDVAVTWDRWKKEAIDKQIRTAKGAERYVRCGRPIFLDNRQTVRFPLQILPDAKFHKIVVAHGAKEACQQFSMENIYGSLAISYGGSDAPPSAFPFVVHIDRSDPVHVLDSHNLSIIFRELDTFYDLVRYIQEKERAIERYSLFCYCGEEDLIAHYFMNYDKRRKVYRIGDDDKDIDFLIIHEGEWKSLIESGPYVRRQEANRVSYFWDELIQKTCQNALDGTLLGNSDLLSGNSALHEMAKEPRFARRALSKHIIDAIDSFPESTEGTWRKLSYMRSFYQDTGYVFLQLKCLRRGDYETDYRPKRQIMLEIACGVARNKFSGLKKVVGIAMDAPKYSGVNSEDFILLECSSWPSELRDHYREANRYLNFFETQNLKRIQRRDTDFPRSEKSKPSERKIGRNETCPCGSGRKYKRCCLSTS